ncbi:MAG: aconitase family protein [Acutalibacteraceae bacterium]
MVIGSCTNGRIEDLEVTAEILKGKSCQTCKMYHYSGYTVHLFEAIRRGWVEIFIEAGAVFSTPTCGPCLGGHMGILG